MAKSNSQPKTNTSDHNASKEVALAKITMRQAVIVSLITAMAGIVGGFITNAQLTKKDDKPAKEILPVAVVPSTTPISVDKLPVETNGDDYILIKDISIFDLRNWRYTPDSLTNHKYSAVNFTNYLHIKKLKPIKYITAHYSTSGLQIDMRCITHPAPVFKRKERPDAIHAEEKQYALQIDVSKMEIGKEFLVVVEATYWNSFNDTMKNDASTYTGNEVANMEELGIIVFFPDSKPFKSLNYYNTPFETGVESSYISNSTTFPDLHRKFIYWSIKEREPGNHYTLKWDW